jgi:hypothetical protein
MYTPGSTPHRPRISLDRLNAQAESHTFSLDQIDFDSPIQRDKFFLCPTLTPLYYTPSYRTLSPAQAVRYNQITGMCFSELIGLFEESLASTALQSLTRRSPAEMPPDLLHGLRNFMDEEAKHCEMWRRLNRLSEPEWYRGTDRYIIRIPALAHLALRLMARRPRLFPAVIWVMLALEEHSMEISRRCARTNVPLEPRYAMAYRLHMEEEVRHVQIDWHLLERFYRDCPRALRAVNARLFRLIMGTFFLRPVNSARHVVDLLVRGFPELSPRRNTMVRELRGLDRDEEYQRMMYSRTATPITFALFDGLPEFRGMGRVMRQYTPHGG